MSASWWLALYLTLCWLLGALVLLWGLTEKVPLRDGFALGFAWLLAPVLLPLGVVYRIVCGLGWLLGARED